MNGEIKVTDDEKKWLSMLATGKSTDDVAKEIEMKPGTFAYKLNLLRAKLGCENMAALIAYSIRNKLIE
jgi:DNA-binding CsgD family transcriptional regulator